MHNGVAAGGPYLHIAGLTQREKEKTWAGDRPWPLSMWSRSYRRLYRSVLDYYYYYYYYWAFHRAEFWGKWTFYGQRFFSR